MAGRKLSKQQRSRIATQQQHRVDKATKSDSTAESHSGTVLGPEISGVVRSNFGQQLAVESLAPEHCGKVFRCKQRSNLATLVAGDRVVWQTEVDAQGVVVGMQERRNVFTRPNARGEPRPLAANIDLVLLVIAPAPEPFANLIDRYLVAVESLGLKSLLVMNKSDLINDANKAAISSLLSAYQSIGYQVMSLSSMTGQGLSELASVLQAKTAVVVGQSGVGKSSLINALAPELALQIGDLSSAAPKGTHTTTTACLLHAENFDIIDSPGIREFGLWHMDRETLLQGFVEFRAFIGRCKFRNCGHVNEPQCALRNAVSQGLISEARMDSYFHILHSLEIA